MYRIVFLLTFALIPALTQAQHSAHQAGMNHAAPSAGVPLTPTEGGQSAFAAIQEIVTLLRADPETDWTKVDIAALQAHLIDMDNLTLRAAAQMESLENGARFTVTSADPRVVASIQRMIPAHVATMDGSGGWAMSAEIVEASTVMQVTGDAQAGQMIRALGFIGVMATGMHHQMHHLAIARGQAVHRQ
ncbi:MAG: hypothetical protein COB16_13210 [Rhodobacteraceae bacterium]|nr:MAG: hypothetical protein COB16_13210 [Paracoccaceae bacterium]